MHVIGVARMFLMTGVQTRGVVESYFPKDTEGKKIDRGLALAQPHGRTLTWL